MITLAGSVVAYEDESSTPGGAGENGFEQWIIVVRDLRNGRTLRSLPTAIANPPTQGFTGNGPATDIVLKDDGSVAWIVETALASPTRAAEYEVHVADKAGSRLVASGTDIDPRSLALANSTVYWTQGHAAAREHMS